jgi:hypothetical protein
MPEPPLGPNGFRECKEDKIGAKEGVDGYPTSIAIHPGTEDVRLPVSKFRAKRRLRKRLVAIYRFQAIPASRSVSSSSRR